MDPTRSNRFFDDLRQDIRRSVLRIEELGLKTHSDVSVIFASEIAPEHIGTEFIVEITGLFAKPERTEEVRNRLAEAVGKRLKHEHPFSDVECFVDPFDRANGFWTSKPMSSPE